MDDVNVQTVQDEIAVQLLRCDLRLDENQHGRSDAISEDFSGQEGNFSQLFFFRNPLILDSDDDDWGSHGKRPQNSPDLEKFAGLSSYKDEFLIDLFSGRIFRSDRHNDDRVEMQPAPFVQILA